MDIGNFTVVDTVTVVLVNPNNGDILKNDSDDSEMTITLAGRETNEYRKAQFEMRREIMKKYSGDKDANFDEAFSEVEEKTYRLMALITKEWNITYNGGCPELSYETALEFYQKNHWVVQQIDFQMSKRANFTEDSSGD